MSSKRSNQWATCVRCSGWKRHEAFGLCKCCYNKMSVRGLLNRWSSPAGSGQLSTGRTVQQSPPVPMVSPRVVHSSPVDDRQRLRLARDAARARALAEAVERKARG